MPRQHILTLCYTVIKVNLWQGSIEKNFAILQRSAQKFWSFFLFQASLQQMRDMGITNDSLSLRALQQTGGNVEAALNLIFEGGLQ